MSHACCLGQVEPPCRDGMGLLKHKLPLCAAEGRNAGMHSGRSHLCATTRRATGRGVSEGALQSGSAGAGAARGNAVCGEQAHPGAGPRHASRRFHREILGAERAWGKSHCVHPLVGGLGISLAAGWPSFLLECLVRLDSCASCSFACARVKVCIKISARGAGGVRTQLLN